MNQFGKIINRITKRGRRLIVWHGDDQWNALFPVFFFFFFFNVKPVCWKASTIIGIGISVCDKKFSDSYQQRSKVIEQMNTYMSFRTFPFAIKDCSAMYTLVIAMEKAKMPAINCKITVLMSLRMLNKAIWMTPRCLDCSITNPKTLSVRHKELKL